MVNILLLYMCIQEIQAGKNRGSGKKMSIVVGPWGGNGGTSWDDGSYHGVREIKLVFERCIDSIRVVYDKNGKPVSAEQQEALEAVKRPR